LSAEPVENTTAGTIDSPYPWAPMFPT
jgi:hypothetical protein